MNMNETERSSSRVELERENIQDSGFSERFKIALGDESAYAFAKRTGINDSLIRKYVTGASVPSLDRAVELTSALNVELLWLATGDGIMRKLDGVKETPNGYQTSTRAPSSPNPDDYTYLPLYDVHASAGHGAEIDQEPVKSLLAFKQDWLRGEMGLNPKDCCLIYVTGDSMDPTLRNSDVVLLDRSPAMISDGVYCLRFDGGLVIKRIQRINTTDIKIISDNHIYDPYIIGIDTVKIIGKVVWAGKKF